MIQKVVSWPSKTNIAKLYAALMQEGAIYTVDGLSQMVRDTGGMAPQKFRTLFRWMATKAPDREPVKIAIAMLGLLEGAEDRALFLTLGRHEEFALYVAVALQNTLENPDRDLWNIAQKLEGWGRINIIERLADTTDGDIKHWLVRDGYKNNIMYEYTAYIAAVTGDLATELASDAPAPEVLDGAAEILTALSAGSPGESISAYAEAPIAVARFLAHVQNGQVNILRLNAVSELRRYFKHAQNQTPWQEAEWQSAIRVMAEILENETNVALVDQALWSGSKDGFWMARLVANALGIDTWDASLQQHISGNEQWYSLMRTKDPARIDRVIALAEQTLPLEEIASGPDLLNGLGLEFKNHSAIDFIVQDLKLFPGKGWRLLLVALKSPVIRNRNMAVNALVAWGKENSPAEARHEIGQALRSEPDEKLRVRLAKLLEEFS